MLSFKESDSLTIAINLQNNGEITEPAYATQIIIEFDDRLDFIKKTEIVNIFYFSLLCAFGFNA